MKDSHLYNNTLLIEEIFVKNHRAIDSYRRFYIDMNFERLGLFEEVKNRYDCNTVIYPGCSIHVTPSFYFQHVVYIDISEVAKEFFRNTQSILNFLNSNKKYKQLPFIQFLDNDYTRLLPIRENNYDLLIALYAGGIVQSCKKYIKPGGIILTDNHHNDAAEVLTDPSIALDALIRRKGKDYVLEKSINENIIKTLKENRLPTKNMKNSGKGLEYVDNEYYFVLKKVR
ncbi:MAG: class I SAM-dependent methyltransferase [Clostridia bacterium]|nr:class I SAM-dependent methyltransferase [Clostridia bacterium]